MAKRLADEVLIMMKQEKKRSSKNLATFLLLKEEIAEAIGMKIPMTAIHKLLRQKEMLTINYVQFTEYVKRHIKIESERKSNTKNKLDENNDDFHPKSKQQEREEFASRYINTQNSNPLIKKLADRRKNEDIDD